ncbi:threonine synthase [Carboxydothermus hydrogenoformans]|uniref:Threonine synthase n=1 Tax=Carboxydothermus hydrogenoformans (strain ATCC BAA-161 / DSM 6008 / Z-2901) TaxID=246194 RepID=Q3AAV4_CARHZ|nr:threonine synthase [Carboxydothermus hydrogenoformans]ABB14708.1 threonine synthase [Carboxydothermus hydrogenoformans Z-2901]
MRWEGVIKAYREYLPVTEKTPLLTLNEGNTPLIYAPYLSQRVGAKVYLKFEGANPTGSFKDRGMVVAVAKAMEEGARAVICASTGNTSAAAAAYAAKAGLKCVVLIPEGNIALGKLAQALFYGAKVIAIKGNFDEALKLVREIGKNHPIAIVNSINPYRIEGQKTAAFEICDVLGDAPDYLFIPVGNAGNITAYWRGFKQYYELGKTKKLPKMMGFEAEGAAAIVKGEPIPNPETIATAIRIGNPASWQGAVAAANESGGKISYVTDEEIIEAYRLLARKEGIMAEPASAASVAGLLKYRREHEFNQDDVVVLVLTGHGLKDPDNALKQNANQPAVVEPDYNEVLKIIL